MDTIVLQQVQAARQALDEQAVKTACFILDGLIRDHAPDSPRKPPQLRRIEALQPDLLVPEMSQRYCDDLISGWVRCQHIGLVFSNRAICHWIEHESGVVLTSADREVRTNDRRPRWRRLVSKSLADLCKRGVLARTDINGKALSLRWYRIARLR